MPKRLLDIIPRRLVPVIGFVAVLLVGYIDYVTGDYSILIFYLVPVSFVSWYHSRGAGIAIVAASGVARFVSDYTLYANVFLHYWNSIQDMLFLLVVALLVSFLRQELESIRRE